MKNVNDSVMASSTDTKASVNVSVVYSGETTIETKEAFYSMVLEKFGIPALEYETEMTNDEAYNFVLDSMKVSDWFKNTHGVCVRLSANVRTDNTKIELTGIYLKDGGYGVDIRPLYERTITIFSDDEGNDVLYNKFKDVDNAVIRYLGFTINNCPANIADVNMRKVLKAISAYRQSMNEYDIVTLCYNALDAIVGNEPVYGGDRFCELSTIRNHIIGANNYDYFDNFWEVRDLTENDSKVVVAFGRNLEAKIDEDGVVVYLCTRNSDRYEVDSFNCKTYSEVVETLIDFDCTI